MRRDARARGALPALRFFAAFAEDFAEVFADAFLATRLAGAGEVFLPDLAGAVAALAAVAAKASTGAANAAAMTTEAATDRAVLRAAPWITFSDENMSVFMGVR